MIIGAWIVVLRKSKISIIACLFSSQTLAQPADAHLTLLVEENYPHASINAQTGKIEGEEVDIVLALLKESGISFSMSIQPWNRAFRRARMEANTCVFPINHTPERDALFQWVRPTQRGGWAIYKRPDSTIVIDKIEDVAGYTIVGKMGIQAIEQIEEITSRRVAEAATDVAAVQLLYRGRADLLISGVRDSAEAVEKAGLPKLKMAFYWKPAMFGLACSGQTDTRIIEQLRAANQRRLDRLEE